MSTMVFGKGVEPGGQELDDERYRGECPECGDERARFRYWENADSGSINQFWSVHCSACGYCYPYGEE